MSMEQAILELAASIRFLADSNRRDLAESATLRSQSTKQGETLADTVEIAKDKITKQRAERDADQQAAGVCHEAAEGATKPRGTTAEDAAADQIPGKKDRDAVLEQAIKDGAASAKAEKDAELEAAVTKVEEESKALDYKTDVRPVLLALAKKAGQPELKDLLTKYGAATGDKLTADQFAGIVADANALIAN